MIKINSAPKTPLSLAMTFKRNVIAILHNFIPGSINSIHFWIFILLILMGLGIYIRMRSTQHPLNSIAGLLFGILTLFFFIQIIGTRRAEFIHERYMIFIVPGCLLLTSMLTQSQGWRRSLSWLFVASLASAGLMVWGKSPRPQGYGDWRGASAVVASLYKTGDIILIPLDQPVLLSYFQYYLQKSIPSNELERNMWLGTQPADLLKRLYQLQKTPERIILFNHYAFRQTTQTVMQGLQSALNCQPEKTQSIQALQVIEMKCEAK